MSECIPTPSHSVSRGASDLPGEKVRSLPRPVSIIDNSSFVLVEYHTTRSPCLPCLFSALPLASVDRYFTCKRRHQSGVVVQQTNIRSAVLSRTCGSWTTIWGGCRLVVSLCGSGTAGSTGRVSALPVCDPAKRLSRLVVVPTSAASSADPVTSTRTANSRPETAPDLAATHGAWPAASYLQTAATDIVYRPRLILFNPFEISWSRTPGLKLPNYAAQLSWGGVRNEADSLQTVWAGVEDEFR